MAIFQNYDAGVTNAAAERIGIGRGGVQSRVYRLHVLLCEKGRMEIL